MNLHNVVAGAIGTINPFRPATVRYSSGYTTSPDGSQTPAYVDVGGVMIQVQALTAGDLRHLEGLNIQGVQRAFYLNGNSQGVVRPLGQGGDLFMFSDGVPTSLANTVWLVKAVIETWDTGWCKIGVSLQMNS